MTDPTIIQPDDVTTTSGSSSDILPDSQQPWESNPTQDPTPTVTITYSEDEDSEIDRVELPENDNIKKVKVTVVTKNGDTITGGDLKDDEGNPQPEDGYNPDELPDKFAETTGVKVILTFTPEDPSKPVKTKVEVLACVHPGIKFMLFCNNIYHVFPHTLASVKSTNFSNM